MVIMVNRPHYRHGPDCKFVGHKVECILLVNKLFHNNYSIKDEHYYEVIYILNTCYLAHVPDPIWGNLYTPFL